MTRDDKTGTVLECMRKIRLGNLNVYSPKSAADWRVSVNLEVPSACIRFPLFEVYAQSLLCEVQHPIGSASHKRRKDRLCYSHEEFKIDLTQVTSSTTPNAPVR